MDSSKRGDEFVQNTTFPSFFAPSINFSSLVFGSGFSAGEGAGFSGGGAPGKAQQEAPEQA